MSRRVIFSLLLSLWLLPSQGYAKCPTGNFAILKVIGDICWECMLPLRVMGIQILDGPMKNEPLLRGDRKPICSCPAPPPLFKRLGIPVSFFEANRISEVVSEAFCFPMFGLQITNPSKGTLDGTHGTRRGQNGKTFMQVHWYIFPVYAILEILTDFVCLQHSSFDLAYITEVDPLWQDDMMTALINPEALLFGNPIASLACIADSVSSSVAGRSIEPLFWCKGSWGNAYPLSGNTKAKSMVEDSASISASFIYKLHRQLILWNTFGPGIMLCRKTPAPIWSKMPIECNCYTQKAQRKG